MEVESFLAFWVVGALSGAHASWVQALGVAGERCDSGGVVTSMSGVVSITVWVVGARLWVHASWVLVTTGWSCWDGVPLRRWSCFPWSRSVPLLGSRGVPLRSWLPLGSGWLLVPLRLSLIGLRVPVVVCWRLVVEGGVVADGEVGALLRVDSGWVNSLC